MTVVGTRGETYLRIDEECNVRPQNEVDKYYWLSVILLVHALREWTPLFRLTALPELARASKKQRTPRKLHRAGFAFCKHLQSHNGRGSVVAQNVFAARLDCFGESRPF